MIGDIPCNVETEHLLERAEYEVLRAKGRNDGLDMLRADEPTVVMVSHELAGDDGVAVLKEIREAHLACEVILITSDGGMDAAIEVLQSGGLDYLRRPIDSKQLELALGRARERRQQQEAIEPPSLLVIEDHEPTLERIVHILEKEGYRVFGAPDGEEGMRVFEEKRIDLILADLKMPKKDGLAVLRETKGAGADVEFIVSSGHGDENAVVEALREGALNFLKKPIEIEQMLLAIHKALEHQTLRRSLAYRNRDVQLMQEMVVRLTNQLELVVEAPFKLQPATFEFLHQLVDALPFGMVVIGSDSRIIFANRHVLDRMDEPPSRLSTGWLSPMGITGMSEGDLKAAFERVLASKPGMIETIAVSKWAFLMMTPLRLVKPGATERFVAMAIRGERRQRKGT